MNSARGSVALGATGALITVLAWHAISTWLIRDSLVMPAPAETFSALLEYAATTALWAAVWDTVVQWVAGMTLCLLVGIPVGLALGRAQRIASYAQGTLNFLRTVPTVALLPLFVLVLGSGTDMLALLSFTGVVWLIIIPTAAGAAGVDKAAIDTARVYRLGRGRTITKVIFPASMPFIATGIRYAATATLLIVVAAHLIVGSPGLGNLILRAEESGRSDAVYALCLATGALGLLLNLVVRAVERRTLRWHPSVLGGRGIA